MIFFDSATIYRLSGTHFFFRVCFYNILMRIINNKPFTGVPLEAQFLPVGEEFNEALLIVRSWCPAWCPRGVFRLLRVTLI